MRFPFAFIFPAEGTFWMDNPACLLDASWVSAEQREAARIYRDYLLAFRAAGPGGDDRPAPGGGRGASACADLPRDGTDPRVSPQTVPPLANVSAETQAAIIDVFKETKKKATVILVLDSVRQHGGEKLDERRGRHAGASSPGLHPRTACS